ncbi:MAG: hypothetical protein ACOVOW_07890 [Spirosomataceae bacterium]|nr:hypothetical protein [Flectobacillus sp.]
MLKNITSLLLLFLLASCTAPKSFFTVDTRVKIEYKKEQLNQLQFYIDRDVELRRELASNQVKIKSGKIAFENGKYINIVLLKKFTPGVCTEVSEGKLKIAFDAGLDNTLSFGVKKAAKLTDPYQLMADKWTNNIGRIQYNDETYYIQPGGADAKLMINKSAINKLEVDKHIMRGVKIPKTN